MKHYEVIYEDGSDSIMSVDDEDAAIEALKEHHRRAKAGEKSGHPAVHRENGQPIYVPPAVRIKRVLVYDDHPVDIHENLPEGKKPKNLLRVESGPHESNYSVKESDELDPALWGGDE